jgi:hypothetical protein
MKARRCCTHRLGDWSLLAGLVLGCWLAGLAAGGQTPANMPEIADLGAATPKALVESMAKVLGENAKPHAWLRFQPPANRALAQAQLQMVLQLQAKAKAVTELVQAKIGNMEAGMVKSMGVINSGGELVLNYQMSQIATDGKVDWGDVKLTENGDKAQVAIAAIGATIQLAKANGKWYLDQEAFAKDADGIKEMIGTLMKVLDQVEQKVKSGQIARQNFIQEYQDLINSSMGPGAK